MMMSCEGSESRWEGFYTPTGLMPLAQSGCKTPPTMAGAHSADFAHENLPGMIDRVFGFMTK